MASAMALSVILLAKVPPNFQEPEQAYVAGIRIRE